MNEDGTPTTTAADTTETVDNLNSDQGGVTTDEIADVLHLPKSESQEEEPENPEETPEGSTPKENDSEQQPNNEETQPETPTSTTESEAPSFTVEIEDANGKKFTVGPEDNLEDILAEFEPKNNGQVLQLMRDLDRLGNEKSQYEAQQADEAAKAEQAEMVANIQKGWDTEIQNLQGEKRLPLDAKIEDRKQEVFKFMAEENDKRNTEGRPLLQSFEDALDKLELREKADAEQQAKKDAREEARRRGNMVGGSSAPATSSSPVYQAGSARSASEAIYSLGLLGK